ncbi:hypothetical protein DERP_008221 [Dermatophagoides pteronyssinus]|uniref:Uncharacterized protein n=1 Tax=Dermatophagoides pteronyssinus TaxID=6956 RepID=A0ABQ8J5W8_DERPT|nr:hypothetical protein DERP_008221 [Dermatophagoides pteronyssinus]
MAPPKKGTLQTLDKKRKKKTNFQFTQFYYCYIISNNNNYDSPEWQSITFNTVFSLDKKKKIQNE